MNFFGEAFGLCVQPIMVDPDTIIVPDYSKITNSIIGNSNMGSPLADIVLPGSAIPNSSALRISAALYTDDTLFQQRNTTDIFSSSTSVSSFVASLSIIKNRQEISDLEDPVQITLGKMSQVCMYSKAKLI